MAPQSLLTQWARLLLDSFAGAGVRDVVISPGSRSTPFCAAALASEKLHCHSVYDERSAAFFAHGQAKATGRPTLLMCTSGSAAAHYLPALIEARRAAVPLLVLTADRPASLQYRGAPQTIDQLKLFGDVPLQFFELGAPAEELHSLRALKTLVASACHLASGFPGGPVHLNARAAKPLEPISGKAPEDEALGERVRAVLNAPRTQHHSGFVARAPASLLRACQQAQRGLIVCGPLPASRPEQARLLVELAQRLGFPLVGEPSSMCGQGRVNALFSLPRLLEEPPDLVLEFAPSVVSAAYQRFASALPAGVRHVVSGVGLVDEGANAGHIYHGDPLEIAQALLSRLGDVPTPRASAHGARWREAEKVLSTTAEALFSELGPENEVGIVHRVLRALPASCALWVGNSLAIREVDLAWPTAASQRRVFVQRGANGIDGHVSGAAGAQRALAAPLLLLIGDVSFAHDVGGLALARDATEPFILAVLDNDGGRIFDQLPELSDPSATEKNKAFWRTPPGLNLQKIAEAYGVRYARPSGAELAQVVEDAARHSGCTLLHLRVEDADRKAVQARLLAVAGQELALLGW